MVNLSAVGLCIITGAWLIQMVYVWRWHKELQKMFVLPYMVGVGFLVIDGFMTGLYQLASLNLLCFVVALFTYLQMMKAK